MGFRTFGFVSGTVGAIAGILLVAGIVVTYSFVFPLLHLKMNTAEMGKLMATPFWYRVALVTRAAVAEESSFRGYRMERIAELSGRRWLAAVISGPHSRTRTSAPGDGRSSSSRDTAESSSPRCTSGGGTCGSI